MIRLDCERAIRCRVADLARRSPPTGPPSCVLQKWYAKCDFVASRLVCGLLRRLILVSRAPPSPDPSSRSIPQGDQSVTHQRVSAAKKPAATKPAAKKTATSSSPPSAPLPRRPPPARPHPPSSVVKRTPRQEAVGGETDKAVANFPGLRPLDVAAGDPLVGVIKASAARANADLKLLKPGIAKKIATAVTRSPTASTTSSSRSMSSDGFGHIDQHEQERSDREPRGRRSPPERPRKPRSVEQRRLPRRCASRRVEPGQHEADIPNLRVLGKFHSRRSRAPSSRRSRAAART